MRLPTKFSDLNYGILIYMRLLLIGVKRETEVHMHAPGDNGKYEGESWNEAIHR